MENINELISGLQKGLEGTDAYIVGQHLKDICRDKTCAAIVAEDLKNKGMGLNVAAGKIKAWSDAQHKKRGGDCVCVTTDVAEKILREFYGLPDAMPEAQEEPAAEPSAPVLDLASFF